MPPPLMSQPQPLAAAAMYDARAADYEKSWHPTFARDFLALAAPSPGDAVLDLACGTGLVTFLAADLVGPTGKVVGVDISEGMLDVARGKKADDDQGKYAHVSLHQHSILSLPTLPSLHSRTATFDLITLCSALVLLPDPAAAIASWTPYLRPGGRLVTDVLTPATMPTGLAFERTGRRLGVPVDYNRDALPSEEALRGMLEGTGLVVERVVRVEQGGGVEEVEVGMAEALFERGCEGRAVEGLGREGVRERARGVFREEWERLAVDAVVRSEHVVWVAVAGKV